VTPVSHARQHRPIRVRALGALAGAALALTPVAILSATRSSPSDRAAATPPPLPSAVSAAGVAQRAGVRVVRVAATGGGGLLDLRYQVVDADVAAAAVHNPKTPPALVDERSGRVLGQLLMGHMHHGTLKAGVTYYLVFLNAGDAVRRGDRVSVVLGGARLQHLRVL
jgi:hypothetical protein